MRRFFRLVLSLLLELLVDSDLVVLLEAVLEFCCNEVAAVVVEGDVLGVVGSLQTLLFCS